jgi:hypothetical protein
MNKRHKRHILCIVLIRLNDNHAGLVGRRLKRTEAKGHITTINGCSRLWHDCQLEVETLELADCTD